MISAVTVRDFHAGDIPALLSLMRAVALQARAIGAPRLHWLVLPDNEPAMRFYRSLGGEPVTGWQSWHLQGPALARLAGDCT